ncbi:replication initiation protein [Marinomonas sp. 2405UD68-3]|uniref:replication initiation protein n=1 Tax=Marinomonas sp. 2405UD68-3 TaxID=3391835 RepID=UPI0039C9926D
MGIIYMMHPRLDNEKSKLAVQDNELVRSAYTMTLLEKRLLLHAISKIDSHKLPKEGQNINVEITAKQWENLYNTPQPWRDLKNASRKLMNRQVTINPTAKKILVMNWVDSTEYTSDAVKISFGNKISHYLTGMLTKFTQIDLLDVAKFDSAYTVRLYELLRQVEQKPLTDNWLKITVEEFRIIFDLGKKYDRFSYLNQRVLTPSVRELNRKSDWNITLTTEKQGRSIYMLCFAFSSKLPENVFIEREQNDKKNRSNRDEVTASIMNIDDTNW